MSKSLILNHEEISLKLDRIAWQILEHHYGEETIVLIGLVDRGSEVAEKIKNRLEKFGSTKILFSTINLDKSIGLASKVTIENPSLIAGNPVILVDDVLNSGVTLSAALREVLNHSPKSIRTAVLANRDHHKFPIQAHYVGISLATTLQENISYQVTDDQMSVWLG
jgi:pyrimidine operon attenuation protein / uracil phosphoribosyltransferase